MSKHGSAEDKLHVSPEVRTSRKTRRRQVAHQDNSPAAPPKGTNANNQYR